MTALGVPYVETKTLTANIATSARIHKNGIAIGTIRNVSANVIVATAYEMTEAGDTPQLYKDQDGYGKTITLGVGESMEFPTCLSGIAILVFKLQDGANDSDVKLNIFR